MRKWIPVHQHTRSSTLDSPASPLSVAKRLSNLEYHAAAVTDHGNLFGVVEIGDEFKKVGIKHIRGNELYLSKQSAKIKTPDNRKLSHLCVLAKNLKGWQRLVKITSQANHPDNFYYKPRLSLDELNPTDLIAFSGHPGSDLGNACFNSLEAYRAESVDKARAQVNPNWREDLTYLAEKYQSIFGKGNFFLEIQLIDKENLPAVEIIADLLRQISKSTGIPTLATADSHYATKEDAHLQRILLCSSLRTTLQTVYNKLANAEEFGLSGFFKSNNYHIPSLEEMQQHTNEELANSLLIADMCEDYSLSRPTLLPSLYGNDNLAIREKCESAFSRVPQTEEYRRRLDNELEVITKNNLGGYFLIVQDYIQFAHSRDICVGPGRGSSAGSLVAYLLGITKIDPIPYGLIFERFYNEGRNTPGNIELPDIDTDFDKMRRGEVINYVKNKYGHDRVGHIVTLSSLQGRGALKEILRVYNACSHLEMSEITKQIPQEAEISDLLEDMRKQKGYSSILEWTLENEPELVSQYCRLEDGKLVGDYARYFELAIKIEGVKKNTGQHASGIVISSEPLEDVVPLHNQGGELIIGLEMDSAKKFGLVKFDILGLKGLSCISDATRLINEELSLCG